MRKGSQNESGLENAMAQLAKSIAIFVAAYTHLSHNVLIPVFLLTGSRVPKLPLITISLNGDTEGL